MGDYVSPFKSGGSSGGGGGTNPRSPGAGYVSPKMANYKSPLSGANYNFKAPPNPLNSGFSVGGKDYNNIDHYVANFDKMTPQQRKAQYDALSTSKDPFAHSIATSLDQKGRSQKESTAAKVGDFLTGAGKATVSATKAIVRPTVDVLTGKGGKAVHDTATLTNDVAHPLFSSTGKLINTAAAGTAGVIGLGEALTGAATHNKQAEQNALDATNMTMDQLLRPGKTDKNGKTDGNGGLWNEGGFFKSAKEAQDATPWDIAKKSVAGGTAVATETLPWLYGGGEVNAAKTAAEAARVAEGADITAEGVNAATKTEKAINAAKVVAKGTAGNTALGTVSSVANQYADTGKVSAKQTLEDAKKTAIMSPFQIAGGAAGSALLGKVFSGGSKTALEHLDAATGTSGNVAGKVEQKLLTAGDTKAGNTSKTVIKGDAGTPATVAVTPQEYSQRFDALSKSFDKATAAAQKQKGSLAQSIAMDQVHESHLAALEQLNHEYINGKANPDFKAPTADKTVETGFTRPTADQTHHAAVATDQRAQLHQRVGQIDAIVKSAQNNGTSRSAEEMRGLMRERQAAQGVLDGTHSYEEVYGKQPTGTQPLPFGDKTVPVGHKPGETMPTKDTPVAPGSSMLTTLPKVNAGDTKAPELHRAYIASQYDKLGAAIQKAKAGMSQHDIKLIESIESPVPLTTEQAAARVEQIAKTAQNPTKFRAAVSALKEFADARLANDTALGRDVSKRENYLSRFYERGTTKQSAALDRLNLTGDSLPGYTKTRSIATQAEADALAAMKNADGTPKYPQLQRKNANVFEDAKQAVDMAKADHGKQAVKLALEQAHPGTKVGVNKIGFDPESGLTYKGLDVKGGNGLSLPQHLADSYNKRAPVTGKTTFGIKLKDGSIVPVKDNELVQQLKSTGGKLVDPVSGKDLHSWKVSRMVRSAVKDPLGSYDKVNANLKYSILGGGTFHAITTGGTVAGQQSMRALTHPLQIPSMIADNLKLVAGTISQKSHDAVMAHHEADGSLSFAKLVGTTLSPKEILGDANSGIVDKMKDSKWNPIKQIHDAVFARQIPEAKMMIMKQAMSTKFKGMDFNAPTQEQVLYGRKVASAVNNIGGINRAVEGLSPNTAKKLSRVLLATDFTEGKMRIVANALTKGGPQGNIARQMVVGKSILFALPGLAALTATGQLDWNKPQDVRKAIVDQLLDPSIPVSEKGAATKSNPGGTNQAIHFPSTFISEFGKIIKPALDPLSTDKLQGGKDYLTNRVAALPAVASRLKQNKDFQGNPIYGTDKNGNPISGKQTALNVANQVSPIPVVQGVKKAGGQSTRDTALNVAGFRVSSDPNAASGQHTKAIQDFYTTLNQASSEHTKVSKHISTLLSQNNPAQAYRVAQQYNDGLPQRLQPFREKYNDHYNPAWDDEFKKLQIPLTAASFKSRQKSNALQQSILNPNY